MPALKLRYIDPVAEIIESLHRAYVEQLTADNRSWRVNVSPQGLLLWGDSDQMKLVYDCVIRRVVSEGEAGSTISLTVLERGNMDECSVWCSKWEPDTEILYASADPQEIVHTEHAPHEADKDMRHCRAIIEMHGGHMWIESAPGSWARVIFVLPKRSSELS